MSQTFPKKVPSSTNLRPSISGTDTIGTPDKPFSGVHAGFISINGVQLSSNAGSIITKGNITPSVSGSLTIGSENFPFNEIYAKNIYGADISSRVARSGDSMTGDLHLLSSNLTVGNANTAISNSVAIGEGNQALGQSSLSAGESNATNGFASIALGNFATASHDNSIVISDEFGASSTNINQMTLGFKNGIVLNSGTSLLSENSGINNIGSINSPFNSLYAKSLFYNSQDTDLRYLSASVASGNFVHKSGDIITGNIIMSGSNVLTSASGTGNVGSLNTPFDTAYFNNIFIDSKQFHPETLNVPNVIRVSQFAQGFTSIANAVASISGASATHPYVVFIEPGIYIEPYINVPSYVDIVGRDENSVVIRPSGNNTVFNLNTFTVLSFLHLENGAVGYPMITITNPHNFILTHKVQLDDCDLGVKVIANDGNTDHWVYFEYSDITSDNTSTIQWDFECSNNSQLNISCENWYSIGSNTNPPIGCVATGSGLSVIMRASAFLGSDNTGVALHVHDGAIFEFESVRFDEWGTAIHNENIGAGVKIQGNVIMTNNMMDVMALNPLTTGQLMGQLSVPKCMIDPLVQLSLMTQNPDGSRSTIMGNLYTGKTIDTLSFTNPLITNAATMGLSNGGNISLASGTLINIASGYGYLDTDPTDWTKTQYVSWSGQNFDVGANNDAYVYINQYGNPSYSVSKINGNVDKILLGRIVSNSFDITYIESVPMNSTHIGNKFDEYLRDVFGAIVADGLNITFSGTQLTSAEGEYYYSEHNWEVGSKEPIPAFYEFYHSGTNWVYSLNPSGIINVNYYDNGNNLTLIPPGMFAKHSLYYSGPYDIHEFVYGQTLFSGQSLAVTGPSPIPYPAIKDAVVYISDIITGSGSISQIIDTRPVPSYKAPSSVGGGGVAYHGQLLGLLNDDHPQYLNLNGIRPMAADLSIGGNNITNVNLVGGIIPSGHSSRHQPNSSQDALLTAAPTNNLDSTTTNAAGGSNSLSRADHSHAITTIGLPLTINTVNQSGISASLAKIDHVHAHGSQTDGTLHSVATSSHNGFLASGDWISFNSKQSSGNYVVSGSSTILNNLNVTLLSGTTISGGSIYANGYQLFGTSGTSPISVNNGLVSIASGSASQDGYISSGDWTTFNSKQASGNYVVSGSSTILNSLNVTLLSGTTISGGSIYANGYQLFGTSGTSPISVNNGLISIASGSSIQDGYISSGDWVTFNSKQASGNYVPLVDTAHGSITASDVANNIVNGNNNILGAGASSNLLLGINNIVGANGGASIVGGFNQNVSSNVSATTVLGSQHVLNSNVFASNVEGSNHIVSGNTTFGHVEGYQNQLGGFANHIGGRQSVNTGNTSFAQGWNVTVTHAACVAMADQLGVSTTQDNEMVLGFQNGINLRSGTDIHASGSDIYARNIYSNQNVTIPNMIRVAQFATGGFKTIHEAVASISGASAIHPYVVFVEPGVYQEPLIVVPSYVDIIGRDENTVKIQPSGMNTVFQMSTNSTLSFLTLDGGSIGYPLLNIVNPHNYVLFHKVALTNCPQGVKTVATDGNTDHWVYFEYCDVTSDNTAVNQWDFECSNNSNLNISCENWYVIGGDTNPPLGCIATGSGLSVIFRSSAFLGTDHTGIALRLNDGAKAAFESIRFDSFGTAVENQNAGAGIDIQGSVILTNNTNDLIISNPLSLGQLQGQLAIPKCVIDPGANISFMTQNPDGSRSTIMGDLYTGKNIDNLNFTNPLITSTNTMGLVSGGLLTVASGLTVSVSAGYGYLDTDPTDWTKTKEITWGNDQITLQSSDDVYLYYNSNGILSKTYSSINGDFSKILLGRVICGPAFVISISNISMDAVHFNNKTDEFLRDVFGPIVAQGLGISQVSGNQTLNMAGGEYYFSSHNWSPASKTPIHQWLEFAHAGGFWNGVVNTSGVVNSTYWDNGANLVPLSGNYFARHGIWYEGNSDTVLFVYANAQLANINDAKQQASPTPPPQFKDNIVPIADIIVQKGSGISLIYDTRPIPQYKSPVLNSVTNALYHNQLLGLTVGNDHPQYLLANGGTDLSGDLNLGGNNIINVNLVGGIVPSGHASRHLPNGADPLATATPIDVSLGGGNAVGIANSLARSDHKHNITQVSASGDGFLSSTDWTTFNSKQPSGAYLISGTTTQGIPEWSGNQYFTTARVITAASGTYQPIGNYQPSGNYLVSGVSTSAIPEGSNLYYTDARAKATISGTGLINVTNGLVTTTATNYTDTNARAVVSGTAPITVSNALVTISSGSAAQNGYISSGDWSIFNAKQPSGNYVVSGSSTLLNVLGVTTLNANLVSGTTISGSTIYESGQQVLNSGVGVGTVTVSKSAGTLTISGTAYSLPSTVVQSASTSGTGLGIYNSQSGSNLVFNSISGNGTVTVTSSNGLINVSGAAYSLPSNVVQSVSSSGVGTSLYNSQNGSSVYLNSISGLGNVTISSQSNGVVNISGTAYSLPSNVVQSASTSGTGFAVYNSQSGSNLVFNSISGNGTVTVTSSNGIVNISGAAYTLPSTVVQSVSSSGVGTSLYNSQNGSAVYLNSVSGLGTITISTQSNGVVNVSGAAYSLPSNVVQSASTSGTGFAVYNSQSGSNLVFNSISGNGTITVTSSNGIINVSGAAYSLPTTVTFTQVNASVVSGTTISGSTIYEGGQQVVNSGVGAGTVTVSQSAGTLTISGTAYSLPSTVVQSASTSGTGLGIYNSQSGSNLVFNTISGVGNINVTLATGVLTVSGTASSSITMPSTTTASGIAVFSGTTGGGFTNTSVKIDPASNLITTGTIFATSFSGSTFSGLNIYGNVLSGTTISGGSIYLGGNAVIVSGTSSGTGFAIYNGKSGNNEVFNTISGIGTVTVTSANGLISVSGAAATWAGGTVTSNIVPNASGSLALGSASLPFGNIYADPYWEVYPVAGVPLGRVSAQKTIEYVMDNGGSVLSSGSQGVLNIPFSGTIKQWNLLASTSGNLAVDVRRKTFTQYSGEGFAAGFSITAADIPTLTNAYSAQNTNITTWSGVNTGDVLEFFVNSITPLSGNIISRATLELTIWQNS